MRHNLLEYAELMLFLLVAMTYINAMDERSVFEALRSWLVTKGYGLRQLFWITGVLAFLISPIADNLTTALLMCAVVLAVGGDNTKFVLTGLYQHRRCGQCRRRLQPVRRHHYPDGLAETDPDAPGRGRFLGFLRPVPALAG